MDWQNILDFFTLLSFWSVVKIFVLLALFVYICFAFIVVRQVSMMTEIVSSQADFVLKTISVLLLGIAIAVFVAALLFL
jgi:hypothetical protein